VELRCEGEVEVSRNTAIRAPIARVIPTNPVNASLAAISLISGLGTISPYPTVVHVTTEKYNASLKFFI
jgi:hypothetical protein